MLKKVFVLVVLSSLFHLINGSLISAEEIKIFRDTGELSYVDTSGNSDSSSFSLNNKFTYTYDPTVTVVWSLGALHSTSENETSAEKYFSNLRTDKKTGSFSFFFLQSGWERERLSGIANRISASGGLGLQFFKNDNHDFKGDSGFNYIYEERTTKEIKRSPSLVANLNYVFKFKENVTFGQDGNVNYDLDDPDNYEFKSVTSLQVSLTAHLAIKNAYTVSYRNAPVPGFETTDRTFSTAVVVNF